MTKTNNVFRAFVMEKTIHLCEDTFTVDGDMGDKIKISASPVKPFEVKNMMKQGKGLRILVGADNMKGMLVVWVGDSNSNVGAMHDTIADQLGMDLYTERHVPLEMTQQGRLRVTTTAQSQFDDPRKIEDVLDRNKEFRKIFGNAPIDYSVVEKDSYQPPEIEVGDEIRFGKFKNRKAEVTGFTKDKYNQPVLKTNKGDKQLFKPRLTAIIK